MTLRLSDTAFTILDRIAADHRIDRTAVMELAIRNLDADLLRHGERLTEVTAGKETQPTGDKEMNSDHETRRQQVIGKIADTIFGHHMSDEDIVNANKAGWTIDIRFSDGQYTSENSWSRIENIHLEPDELAEAKQIAVAFEKNPWRDGAQIAREVRATTTQ
jgi:predicted transcriptional regulator